MDPRKPPTWLPSRERAALLQAALEAAAEGDAVIEDLVAALADQVPGLGRHSALELLAAIGLKAMELDHG